MDLGEAFMGLFEETGEGLAAGALAFVVGAVEEGVDVGAKVLELLIEAGVDGIDVGAGIEPERDTALVGDDNDPETGLIELGNGLCDAREELKFIPAPDVVTFGHFAIDDAIAIEEDRFKGLGVAFELDGHDRASITTESGDEERERRRVR